MNGAVTLQDMDRRRAALQCLEGGSLMPWTPKQVKKLLGPDSPLTPEQQQKMKSELANNPSLGHARKGSKALKRPK